LKIHYLERIERIHKMILHEKTGSPDEFAGRLGISRTRLYEIMEELKFEGAPILYSKTARTFYYEEPFHIEISVDIKSLDNE
jgi:biotin operon repressor